MAFQHYFKHLALYIHFFFASWYRINSQKLQFVAHMVLISEILAVQFDK